MWFSLYLISTAISGAINVSKSMYIKRKMDYNNDEVVKKYNKLSSGQKVASNLKNIFMTLCPIVNIIHSIKTVKTSNDTLYSKWKKNTLESYVYLDRRLDEEPATETTETTEATETVQETRTPNTTNDREIPPLPARRQSTPNRNNGTTPLPARRTSNRTNGSTPLPARRTATENNEYVIEPEVRRPSRPVANQQQARRAASAQSNPRVSPLDYLKSEYNKEKRIYERMVSSNASREELRAQGLKVNAIVEKYNEVKNRNNTHEASGPRLRLNNNQ